MHVVYSEAMNAPAQGASPSAAKPAAVVAAWRTTWPTLEFRAPEPVTLADFERAHTRTYIDDVFALRVPNGFGTFSKEVNASLPYTSGALLTAARWALAAKTAVAAPVSGFHHAGHRMGADFCTFNGLMVAALALQAEHWTRPEQAEDFLKAISTHLDAMTDCDVVLYQAGADPHIDDPLGGFLTTTQMAQRDWRVFNGLRERGIPVAWVLAGGYQTPLSKVVDLHVNTMRAALAAHSP